MLAKALLLSAATELLFNRLLSRAAIFLPAREPWLFVWPLVNYLGALALNLTVILGVILLAWEGYRRWCAGQLYTCGLVCIVLVVTIGSLAGGNYWNQAGWLLAVCLLLAGVQAVAARQWSNWQAPVWFGSLALALFSGNYLAFLQGRGWLAATRLPMELYYLGEIWYLALPVIMLLPIKWKPTPWLGTGAAIGVATAAIALLANRHELVAMLTIWSLGLPLSWPAVVYGLPLASLVYCLVVNSKQPLADRTLVGLLLVLLAGYSLTATYQYLLLAAGILVYRPMPSLAASPKSNQVVAGTGAGTARPLLIGTD